VKEQQTKNQQASRPKVITDSERSALQLVSEVGMKIGPALQAVLKQLQEKDVLFK
jgi:hypothetical protein